MTQHHARAYLAAQAIYTHDAETILHELILDELGDDYYQQLRYEAACMSLKEFKKKIDTTQAGKQKRHYLTFYEDKLKLLDEKAGQYDPSPYTL